MKNTDLVQLLRELAKYLEVSDIERGTVPAKSARLAARARQAAEEIEGREVPSDEELAEAFADGCFPEAGSSLMLDELIDFNLLERCTTLTAEQVIMGGLRAVLAHFGGDEGSK